MTNEFHGKLKILMDDFVHLVYDLSRRFPQEELYGVTSQLRRAALSVILNYIEGYARRGDKVYSNFLKISYGSLKESKYLLYFSYKESYIKHQDYKRVMEKAEEIGAMLWGVLRNLS